METSEPGANRDTGTPAGRNTTLSTDHTQCASITSLLSTDSGQIVGTDPRETICVWELWSGTQRGYLYNQPAGGWVARTMSDGQHSGQPFQARTPEDAVHRLQQHQTDNDQTGHD